MLTLQLEITEDDAWDLANFLKRITYSGVRECAQDDAEAYRMLSGIYAVQKALNEEGLNPR